MSASIMREEFIKELIKEMAVNDSIFFVTADFGSPSLDQLKSSFPERFVNVGIAEQNLINVSAGLALEGAIVFAYAIAPFITMRCFEQIRVNLALLSGLKKINVNLIGVGAGFSYVCAGPSHQALEDISIIRSLPNIEILSPSDWVSAKKIVKYSLNSYHPKYIRLDGMKLEQIYNDSKTLNFNCGFDKLIDGNKICIISTGYMTHKAINLISLLKKKGITPGLIDIYKLTGISEKKFIQAIEKYKTIITLEEGFINKGGVDSMILHIVNKNKLKINFYNVGLSDTYKFELGTREQLHNAYGAGLHKVKQLILKNW